MPVVDPGARDATTWSTALQRPGKAVYVALHANHAARADRRGPRRLRDCIADAGIALVSQTVLLKGVNDDAETLAALMRAFVEARIKPYYLHHADLAPGTAHFRTTIAEGQALMRALRGRVSGLRQPTYVLDIPGGHGKVPVGPGYFLDEGIVEDVNGERRQYLAGPIDKG